LIFQAFLPALFPQIDVGTNGMPRKLRNEQCLCVRWPVLGCCLQQLAALPPVFEAARSRLRLRRGASAPIAMASFVQPDVRPTPFFPDAETIGG
jgi:hypothetical protein